MRAAALRHGQVAVKELPDPSPGPGQLLVRVLSCGVCASDVHFMDEPDAVAEDDSGLWDYHPDRDIVMGHELVGEVVGHGPGAGQAIPLGARVTSLPVLLGPPATRIFGCSPDVPGGFGELMLMSEPLARVVPEHVPLDHAALVDAFAVGEYYVRRADLRPDDVPLVVGAGAIGLSAVAALHRRGVERIVVSDLNAERRRTAEAFGASHVVDPREQSPYETWRDVALGGGPARGVLRDSAGTAPGCVAFEFVGVPGVLDEIVRSCERDTRILSAGGPPAGDHISSMVAKRKGLSIQFGGGPEPQDWYGTLDAVVEGRLDVSPAVGEAVPLEGVVDAVDRVRRGVGPARPMVHPGMRA